MAKIYWCICTDCRGGENFGDMLTPYIYKQITGKDPVRWTDTKTIDPVYYGAGSIMATCRNWKDVTIWGTGIMNRTDSFHKPRNVLSVRGPLTRQRFLEQGYECPEVYGDIGLIMPRFYSPQVGKRYRIGLIPHYVDYGICKHLFKDEPQIFVIDLCNPVEQVIREILQCWITASSSLHGIIVSHAYQIPCAWLKFSNRIGGGKTKYLDYYGSIGIHDNLDPVVVKEKIEIEKLVKTIREYTSPEFPINTDHIMDICPFHDQRESPSPRRQSA